MDREKSLIMALTDKTGATVEVVDEADRPAFVIYEVSEDGQKKEVGFTQYREEGDERVFNHTSVPEEFGGRGLGTIVVAEAMKATAAAGKTVVPVCPMVAGWLKKNGEDYKAQGGTFRETTPEDH